MKVGLDEKSKRVGRSAVRIPEMGCLEHSKDDRVADICTCAVLESISVRLPDMSVT